MLLKFPLVWLLTCFVLTAAWAQSLETDLSSSDLASRKSPTVEEIASYESNWMRKKLKLSPKQFELVKSVTTYYATLQEDKRTAHQREIPTPVELQQIVAENARLEEEKEEAYKRILTANQWHVYRKKKKHKTRSPVLTLGNHFSQP